MSGPGHKRRLVSFEDLQPINRHLLTERAGALALAGRHEICRTLAALADC